jgi:hypothetical protein
VKELKRSAVYPTLFILLIGACGLVIAYQGWRSRFISFDMLAPIDEARQFLLSGRIPEKGTLTGFASYTPPGTVWLLLPGMSVFNEPRLYESIGSGILYVGTIVGIFLLARLAFGRECAYLAATLWTLSEIGLTFGESTNLRGHPFFYVWTTYFVAKWAELANAKHLTCALLTWIVGMYCFMEIAPAILCLPMIWLRFRPRLPLQSALIACSATLVVWFPYLRFESGRRFADIVSQITRHRILPLNAAEAWCNPALVPIDWLTWLNRESASVVGDAIASPFNASQSAKALLHSLASRLSFIVTDLLPENYVVGWNLLWVSWILIVITLIAMLSSCVRERSELIQWIPIENSRVSKSLKLMGLAMVFVALLFNEIFVAVLSPDSSLHPMTVTTIRTFQIVAVIFGLALLTLNALISKRVVGLRNRLATGSISVPAQCIGIALAVPWLIMTIMTEASRPQRMWWLSPVQMIILTWGVLSIFSSISGWRVCKLVGCSLLVVSLLANSFLISRITGWINDGWSGHESAEIETIDYIANLVSEERPDAVAVGYSIRASRFKSMYHVTDSRYRVGADFNLFLSQRHGLSNLNNCAEGISPDDRYRIIQSDRNGDIEERIIVANEGFHAVATIGHYQIAVRN